MLLINHPLDCPICDQAGECELQDYTYPGRARRGPLPRARSASTRSRTSAATSCTSPNRCILCTRCVRFMDDVAHDPVLNVERARRPRADRQVRGPGPHAPVGRQRHRPLPGRRAALQGLPEQGARLGARSHGVGLPELLAGLQHDRRDARQSGRAPASAAERGGQQVLHVRPRPAELPLDEPAGSRRRAAGAPGAACSRRPTGRSRSRAAAQLLRGQARVRARVAEPLERSAVPARPSSRRRRAAPARSACAQGAEAPLPGVEDLALRADRAANVRGAELLGFTRSDTPLVGPGGGRRAHRRRRGAGAARRVGRRRRRGAVIVIGTTLPAWARHAANVVLPIANCVEEEGTFTNLRGRVQRFLQAKAAPGRRAAELLRARRSARRAGRGHGLLDGRPGVRRARGERAGVRRPVVRRARAARRDDRRARRRERAA